MAAKAEYATFLVSYHHLANARAALDFVKLRVDYVGVYGNTSVALRIERPRTDEQWRLLLLFGSSQDAPRTEGGRG